MLEKAAVKIKKSLGIKQKYNKREISNPQAEITQKTLFRAHEDATIHTVDVREYMQYCD